MSKAELLLRVLERVLAELGDEGVVMLRRADVNKFEQDDRTSGQLADDAVELADGRVWQSLRWWCWSRSYGSTIKVLREVYTSTRNQEITFFVCHANKSLSQIHVFVMCHHCHVSKTAGELYNELESRMDTRSKQIFPQCVRPRRSPPNRLCRVRHSRQRLQVRPPLRQRQRQRRRRRRRLVILRHGCRVRPSSSLSPSRAPTHSRSRHRRRCRWWRACQARTFVQIPEQVQFDF